jgi:hypothetical protein
MPSLGTLAVPSPEQCRTTITAAIRNRDYLEADEAKMPAIRSAYSSRELFSFGAAMI